MPIPILSRLIRGKGLRAQSATPPARLIQGYVDEILATRVAGWIRDGFDPGRRIGFTVALALPEGSRVIARGRADQLHPALSGGVFGDGKYGFLVEFPVRLSAREREHLVVLPAGAQAPLEQAGAIQGFVEECSVSHVAGWVRNRFDPVARIAVEVVVATPEAERVIARGIADRRHKALAQQAVGDAQYGFSLIFPEPVATAEREALIVRPVGSQAALAFVPDPVTSFALLSFVAMDIVNNCNLRCPFCLFDYAETKTTRLMPEEVFDSALRLLPHARDAGFWLSCLHEPSLHPGFLRLIERIPRQWRHKVMFTTNLAKRMPEAYFAALAESGVFHINISLESTTPAIYEKFRQGARWPIFKENWDRLIRAWQEAAAPPRLRYIIMAYRSNLAELPELVRYLREARLAWQVELRCTMEMSHIPVGFAAEEYLGDADWNWLETQLAGYSSSEVLIVRPIPPPQEVLAPEGEVLPAAAPQVDPAAPPALPELPLNMLVEWDGSILVCNKWEQPSERKRLAVARIQEIADPCGFLLELAHTPVPAYLPDRRYGPLVQGYIDALSAEHVSGWIRDAQAPEEKIAFEIVIEDGEATRVVAQGVADALYGGLAQAPFDDHDHGFHVVLAAPLSVAEQERLVVRDVATKMVIRRAPHLERESKEAVLF